jgi:hypothetical protein
VNQTQADGGAAVVVAASSGADRLRWSPARDLHPARRVALLPGLDASDWSQPQVLRHVSCHLLDCLAGSQEPDWTGERPALRLAVLPQDVLAPLARRIGLALTRPASGEGLDDEESAFLAHRAPMYWRGATVEAETPEAAGWQALHTAVDEPALRCRFVWKTAPATEQGSLPITAQAAQLLALRVLRELE